MLHSLGILIGQTNASIAVGDSEGNLLSLSRFPTPVDGRPVPERVDAELVTRVASSLASNGLEKTACMKIALAVSGLRPSQYRTSSGYDHEKEKRIAEAVQLTFHSSSIHFEHDAYAALLGAIGEEPGVLVSSGTGTVACVRDEEGGRALYGGWGPLLGDDGGAASIGRAALRTLLRQVERGNADLYLAERLTRALGMDNLQAVRAQIGFDTFGQHALASLAPVLHQEAVQGNSTAVQVLEEAGKSLAELGVEGLRHLRMRGCSCATVAFSGGVFSAGQFILRAMADQIRDRFPHARLVPPKLPPSLGILLATYEHDANAARPLPFETLSTSYRRWGESMDRSAPQDE